MKLLQNVEPCK